MVADDCRNSLERCWSVTCSPKVGVCFGLVHPYFALFPGTSSRSLVLRAVETTLFTLLVKCFFRIRSALECWPLKPMKKTALPTAFQVSRFVFGLALTSGHERCFNKDRSCFWARHWVAGSYTAACLSLQVMERGLARANVVVIVWRHPSSHEPMTGVRVAAQNWCSKHLNVCWLLVRHQSKLILNHQATKSANSGFTSAKAVLTIPLRSLRKWVNLRFSVTKWRHCS